MTDTARTDTAPAPGTPGLGSIVEQSLLPWPNSVDLDATPMRDYQQRFTRDQLHPAETFHEACKTAAGPLDDRTSADLAWARAFRAGAYRVPDAYRSGRPSPIRRPGAVLARLDEALAEPLYAVDVYAIEDGTVLRRLPDGGLWIAERRAGPHRVDLGGDGTPVFFAGVPWRYMMFLGPRGYRHLAFDVGRVLERLRATLGDGWTERIDLDDRAADALLGLDGVERGTFAAGLLRGGDHDG